MFTEPLLTPHGRYVRSLAGADFSLQANTSDVPEEGMFFVLKGSEVLFRSEEFEPANAHYKELCRSFWSERLGSADRATQMASAWGLLGIDINHSAAGQTISKNGSAADLKRYQQLRNRARYGKTGAVARRPSK